jgi:uncharacterized RDD family membrane protein YckC
MTQAEAKTPTIACRRCGRTVTTEAPRCPECKADPRTGLSSFRNGERDCVRVCEGVGIRLAALAVDLALIGVVSLLIALAAYLIMVGMGEFSVVGEEPAPDPLWAGLAIGAFLYFWIGEARWTRTPGKRFFDLRVVRVDGGRVGYGAALVRTLLCAVDWLLAAPLIWGTRMNQRLGDLAARTVVVRPRTMPAEEIAAGLLPTAPWPGEASSGPPAAPPPGAF